MFLCSRVSARPLDETRIHLKKSRVRRGTAADAVAAATSTVL